MAILGGSPLGLINTTSVPRNGVSTFNGGNSRNVNVDEYNRSRAGSLFTGKRIIRAWPNIKPLGDGTYDTIGEGDVDYAKLKAGDRSGDTYTRRTIHSNGIYDTSVLNIVDSLAGTKAALRPSDFAYLKDVGVYPNNRLMVARRFATPIDDNIMVKKKNTEVGALATMIAWLPEGSDFLNISFGEKWTDADADFKNILNRIGGDFTKSQGSKLGDIIGGGAGLITLPTFTEIFQRKLLSNLGLMEKVDDENLIPSGNPNLIKEAKRRTLVPYESPGSGLDCKVSIRMECEWELKFISGIDPTIVWMDILGMIARFGTSPSNSYGFSKGMASKINNWLNNPKNLVTMIVQEIKNALNDIKDELISTLNNIFDSAEKKKSEMAAGATASSRPNFEGFVDGLLDIGNKILEGTALKYRVEILGIVNALTGNPSTPWHITIGNPMRPVFCSGDMLTQDVSVTLGPTLAFNDLPSTIKASFTLTNARPWGLQEIMAKFNAGYLRTIDVQKTYYETKASELPGMLPWDKASTSENSSGKSPTASSVASSASDLAQSTSSAASPSTKAVGGQMPVQSPVPTVVDSTAVSSKIPPGVSTTNGQVETGDISKFFPKKT